VKETLNSTLRYVVCTPTHPVLYPILEVLLGLKTNNTPPGYYWFVEGSFACALLSWVVWKRGG